MATSTPLGSSKSERADPDRRLIGLIHDLKEKMPTWIRKSSQPVSVLDRTIAFRVRPDGSNSVPFGLFPRELFGCFALLA